MASMLTTIDNPYNPFENFDEWYNYDITHGYNSCSYLARVANTSDSLTDEENEQEVTRAIDEILRYDPLNLFIKVEEKDKEKD